MSDYAESLIGLVGKQAEVPLWGKTPFSIEIFDDVIMI